MFTSRAEYRLRLRADNADQRLTPIGRRVGIVDDRRWARFQRKCEALTTIESLTSRGSVNGVTLSRWIRRDDANIGAFADALAGLTDRTFCADHLNQALIQAKYAGYVDRQDRQIDRFRRLESMAIPARADYAAMTGLRAEAREQLTRVSPTTLGQASRITGVNPADVTVLWIYLSRRGPKGVTQSA